MITLEAFYDKYKGQSLLYSPSPQREYLRGQCVQLAAYYVAEVWGKPVIWDDAFGWYADGRLTDQYDRIANNKLDANQMPPRGALIVWGPLTPGSGGAGHIAICMQAVPGQPTFVSFDSNWGGKTAHLVTHNWSNVIGWILPKGMPTVNVPQPTEGLEMISSRDEATKLYQMLRPNGGASEAEIAATAGKRTYAQFLNDAQAEVNARNTNEQREAQELANLQSTLDELNRTVTALKTSQTQDAGIRAKEQQEAQAKISYLTSQLETTHDKITDIQNQNPAQQAAAANLPKPNFLTKTILVLLSIKKKK